MNTRHPLVSVVTPVYNGEKYIEECVESILKQSYENWEYIIVNNCCTDKTPELIEQFAQKDERIKIHKTSGLLPVIENHNFAFSLISHQSKYCKLVQADDWLFPNCIEEMVKLGEQYDSAKVIGAYSMVNRWIKCDGLAYPTPFLTGKEICRQTLLGRVYPFYSPTSIMIHSDLIRDRKEFYNINKLHGDVEAMYEVLQHCDFGFVHQILTYIRQHDESLTSSDTKPLNKVIWSNQQLFMQFAKSFLSEKEYKSRLKALMREYYEFLALSAFGKTVKDFWKFHINGLKNMGISFSYFRLVIVMLRLVVYDHKRIARIVLRRLK